MPDAAYVYKKYREADDDAGDAAWAVKLARRAVRIGIEDDAQRGLASLELGVEEKAIVHILRIPRRYTDVESINLLAAKEMRRFLRALHAADVLEGLDADQAKALVPIEIKRALAQAQGQQAPETRPKKRLQAQVYRPPIDGIDSPSAVAQTQNVTIETPARSSVASASSDVSEEDQDLEREVDAELRKQKKADYFAIMGLDPEASGAEVKKAYFDLARRFHPDRLAGHSFADPEAVQAKIERVFGRISEAYRVLQDDDKRREYRDEIKAGRVDASTESGGKIRRTQEAQLQFRKALVFLQKKDYAQAVRLFKAAADFDAEDLRFPAHAAWAVFLDESRDKSKREKDAREGLQDVLKRGKCADAEYFLGVVCKLAGDEKVALRHFQNALALDPKHRDAVREVRLNDMRQQKVQSEQEANKGLFDRLRRR